MPQTRSFTVDPPRARRLVDYLLSRKDKLLSPSNLELFDELCRISQSSQVDIAPPSRIERFARSGGPRRQDFELWFRLNKRVVAVTSHSRIVKMKASLNPGDPNFKRIARERGWVYPNDDSVEPTNLVALNAIMRRQRPSVSEEQYPSTHVKRFVKDLEEAVNEESIRQQYLLQLLGTSDHAYAQNLKCSAIARDIEELARPQPDHVEGVRNDQIAPLIHAEAKSVVIPSDCEAAPCLGNFFVECKTDLEHRKLRDQTMNDGVMGARGFEKLLGLLSIKGGCEAHTICATLVASTETLTFYCMHVDPPKRASKKRKRDSDRPKYFLTYLKAYFLREQFIEAVTALRNLRDWAATQRADVMSALESRATETKRGGAGRREG